MYAPNRANWAQKCKISLHTGALPPCNPWTPVVGQYLGPPFQRLDLSLLDGVTSAIRQQSDDVLQLSHWFTLLLLCTSAALDLCYDWFNRGSGQAKLEPVDLVKEDYDVSLCQQIWSNHNSSEATGECTSMKVETNSRIILECVLHPCRILNFVRQIQNLN